MMFLLKECFRKVPAPQLKYNTDWDMSEADRKIKWGMENIERLAVIPPEEDDEDWDGDWAW